MNFSDRMSSQPFLGFVLLTHKKPDQIIRLIDRLNFMFGNPPIVCHHDFSQCDLPLNDIPENVTFVRPHVKTAWADWSLVEATLRALRFLYERSDRPQWFTLLSETDYPIKPSEQIIQDLKRSKFDAHISSNKLKKGELENEKEEAFYQRYHAMIFKYPSIVHLVQSVRKRKWVKENIQVKNPVYTRYFIPFSANFICYMGSQWFSANQKAVKCILDYHKQHSGLKKYYKKVHCPDESYFHTILNNSEELKISSKYWRYTDWTNQAAHPKTLVTDDLPDLVESDAHFARKFDLDEDEEVFNKLDELIGYKQNKEFK